MRDLSRIRSAVVAYARWACSSSVEPFWHYRQSRPIPLAQGKARKLPITTDCSGFATICAYQAGAPDPNGLKYNGQGYTGTLLQHLKHTTLAAAQPGDLIVYGAAAGRGHHVVVIVEAGPDPLVASHGTERGPLLLRHSQELRYQAKFPGVAVLSIL